MNFSARSLLFCLSALVLASTTYAQTPPYCVRPRLDSPTCEAYLAIVDSAKKAKLPTAPLEDKANQGLLSESDGPVIIAAVRKLEHNLNDAKKSLGSASSDDELKAGAEALDAGVPTSELAHLRAGTPSPHKRSLACALVVVTSLIAINVPVHDATNNVDYLVKSGITDAVLQKYQRDVQSMVVEHHGDPQTVANNLGRAVPIPGIIR